MKGGKIVILCIDAADFDVITFLISKGLLKTFEKIVTNGVFGPLKSTIPPFTAPAWTSFFTGVYPDKHGVYDFVIKKDSYSVTPSTLEDVRVPALWDFLGGSKCIINVPMTFPAPGVDGIFISGFPFSGDRCESFYPSTLLETIEKKFGYYPLHDEHFSQEEMPTEDLFNNLLEVMEKRKEIYVHFLRKDFDFYIVQFQNLDKIQHKFWCFWDDRYIGFEKNDTLYNAVERAYTRVDDIVGELLACLCEEDILFVVSDHGFGLIDMVPALNNWLLRHGFLTTKTRTYQSVVGRYKHGLLATFKKLRLNLVLNVVPPLLKRLKSVLRSARITADSIDWEQTKAYSLGYPLYIYMNRGLLTDEACESVKSEIICKLSEDMNFERVYSKEELYKNGNQSPDIIVKLKEYPLQNRYKNVVAGSGHRETGIFIAYGPGIKKGCTIKADMVDIAPTVLHMCNIPIPSHMDGSVLHIFEEDSDFVQRKIEYSCTDKEEMRIKEKIRMLKEKGKFEEL